MPPSTPLYSLVLWPLYTLSAYATCLPFFFSSSLVLAPPYPPHLPIPPLPPLSSPSSSSTRQLPSVQLPPPLCRSHLLLSHPAALLLARPQLRNAPLLSTHHSSQPLLQPLLQSTLTHATNSFSATTPPPTPSPPHIPLPRSPLPSPSSHPPSIVDHPVLETGPPPLPLTLLTGYLASGKSTLLANLLLTPSLAASALQTAPSCPHVDLP